MSSTWTMYGRQAMLGAFLAPDTSAAMGALQVALTRAVPVANAAPSQLVEPEGGGYVRADYQALSTHWTPTGFGEYVNSRKIDFPEAFASWGLICGWALIYPGGDQCLAVGSIQTPFVAGIGVVPTIAPGVLLLGNYD